jgi:hypothetical protein
MKIISVPLLAMAVIYSSSVSANLLSNPDFESGTLSNWTLVGQNSACNVNQVVDYTNVPGSGGPDSIPSLGGTYAAYLRPGGILTTGISQTVAGVPLVELSYSVDFYVREVQLSGDSRTEQTIFLYLNGDLVDQLTVAAPTDDPGTSASFSGTYTTVSDSVEFRIESLRPDCSFAWGQLLIDNAVLDCSNPDDCVAPPPTATPVPTMSAYGLVLTAVGLLVVAGLGWSRRKKA